MNCPNNGRPALDAALMFKALSGGHLFGLRSERQLMREIAVNIKNIAMALAKPPKPSPA